MINLGMMAVQHQTIRYLCARQSLLKPAPLSSRVWLQMACRIGQQNGFKRNRLWACHVGEFTSPNHRYLHFECGIMTIAQVVEYLSTFVAHFGRLLLILLIRLCTLFYNRPLWHYTVAPIQKIIACRHDRDALKAVVMKFRKGKEAESRLIGLAVSVSSSITVITTNSYESTLAAAAVIGVFSWQDIITTHWYCKALFYTSLLLAIFSLIGSSQQRLSETIMCLENTSASDEERKEALRVFMNPDDLNSNVDDRRSMSWYTCNMCFIWQWTLMLMTWSWMTFLVALMLHVIKPFLPEQDPDDAERNVSMMSNQRGYKIDSSIDCDLVSRRPRLRRAKLRMVYSVDRTSDKQK